MKDLNLAKSKILKIGKNRVNFPLFLLLISVHFTGSEQQEGVLKEFLNKVLKQKRSADFYAGNKIYRNGKKISLDTAHFSTDSDTLLLCFNEELVAMSFRENSLLAVHDSIRKILPDSLKEVPLKIWANKCSLADFIPDYSRNESSEDKTWLTSQERSRKNVVHKIRSFKKTEGLDGANMALSNSYLPGFKRLTDHAVTNRQFYSVNSNRNFTGEFNTDYVLDQYPVELPDGIEANDANVKTIFRYTENGISAGSYYQFKHKTLVPGFLFES